MTSRLIAKKSVKDKALKQIAEKVLKYWTPPIKIWIPAFHVLRVPNAHEIREIVRSRPLFEGGTFLSYYESRKENFKEYANAEDMFYAYVKSLFFELEYVGLLPPTSRVYKKEKTSTDRQFLVDLGQIRIHMIEIVLPAPVNCILEKTDGDTTSRVMSDEFSHPPASTRYLDNFLDLFEKASSFMYCFSTDGTLRMVEYLSEAPHMSKHVIMCSLNTSSCCAGVMLRHNQSVIVDRLSGTYVPNIKNLQAFGTILKTKFPSTNFVVKTNLKYLQDNVDYALHPDFKRFNFQKK